MDSMDIDQSNRDEPLRLKLRPVKPLESGEGLPYAPENWPNPGDTWHWKVGPRVSSGGHFKDRYLYPPKRIQDLSTDVLRNKKSFRSTKSLEHFVRVTFPDADVQKFFASFSWTIPSRNGILPQKQLLLPVYNSDEDLMHDNESDMAVCKAGNDKCGSLMPSSETKLLPAMPCDIFCGEPNFCTDCCCILCCKTITLEHEGYSYIKCDAKKDLVPHVNRFLEICQTVEHQDDVEKILNLGICILRGSQRDDAKELLNCIESTVTKLKCGTSLEELWNVNTPTIWSDFSDSGEAKDNDTVQTLRDVAPVGPMPFNHEAEMHIVEEEIREVLKSLIKAQKIEYQIAERKLHAQKECLSDLYTQLEKEKSELSRRVSGADADSLMTSVLKRMDQIRKEVTKLKEMEEVAKGFGRTSKGILEECFHLSIEE